MTFVSFWLNFNKQSGKRYVGLNANGAKDGAQIGTRSRQHFENTRKRHLKNDAEKSCRTELQKRESNSNLDCQCRMFRAGGG